MKDITKFGNLFLDDYGQPLRLTPGQKEIFRVILRRRPKRNVVICATRYGKSLTVSLGLIVRAVLFPEKWAVVAPTEKKARIIMNYVIQHLFDSPPLSSQLDIDIPLERLKRERSKQRLTFKKGGEIFILSADVRNRQRAGEALMGFGAPNLILDESALIDDGVYITAKRMIGGHPDNFLMEIGNPFFRNHFLKSYQSDGYNKIVIDWRQAVEEGRFSQKFIDEMREGATESQFNIFYECQFPRIGEIDEEGWTAILTDIEIREAMGRWVDLAEERKEKTIEEAEKTLAGMPTPGRIADYLERGLPPEQIRDIITKEWGPLKGGQLFEKGLKESEKRENKAGG